jgi:hypothetical protein
MQSSYRHARQKGIKIYQEQEIKTAKSDLEKARRQFWNEKAEQLCSRPETAHGLKTSIYGIIDVAWLLRKTSILENEARKIEKDERDLFSSINAATSTSKGKERQKSTTIPHNLSRMSAAHEDVIVIDKKLKLVQDSKENASSSERKEISEQYKKKEVELSGAITELKRAQDALTKSLKHRKELIDKRLKANKEENKDESVI